MVFMKSQKNLKKISRHCFVGVWFSEKELEIILKKMSIGQSKSDFIRSVLLRNATEKIKN